MSIYGLILLGFLFLTIVLAGVAFWAILNRKVAAADHKLWDDDSQPGPLDKN